MIVSGKYEGDTDTRLMWLQHDCYHSSLQIMWQHAETSAEEPIKSRLAGVNEIDHRTLQDGHDILAAAFRHYFKMFSSYEKTTQDNFFGQTHVNYRQKKDFEIIGEWQNWLEIWLIDKIEIGETIASVMLNQNNEQGYAAEDKLGDLIRLEFGEIGWYCLSQPQNKTSPHGDDLISEENQHEHPLANNRRFFGRSEKMTEILLEWVGNLVGGLIVIALVGAAIYHALLYYLEHYLLAALGMMIGMAVGCVVHDIWVNRILLGLIYGLVLLLGAWLLFGLLSSGGGDPDCYANRWC